MKYWQLGAALLLAGGCSSGTVASINQRAATDPAPAVASLNLPTATVVSVGDGDTLRMDYQGENITLRFACIDSPETSQTPCIQPPPNACDNLPPEAPRFNFVRLIPTATGAWWLRSTRVARTSTSRWSEKVMRWSIPNS